MSLSFPFPDIEWEPTRGFWEAASREKLALPRCPSCGRWDWYPTGTCSGCEGVETAWQDLSGEAELFSWAVVERAFAAPFADRVPFVAALVLPREAPSVRIPTNLVDCDVEKLRAGLPLRAVFRALEFTGVEGHVVAPLFAPEG